MDRPERRFYFRLALALGKTVEELLSEISSHELTEWYAYNRLEPIPEPWRQTGLQCSTIASSATGKFIPAEDFMPLPRTEQTPEQVWERFKLFAQLNNAQQ